MSAALLLMLMGLGLFAVVSGGSDEEEVTPQEPEEPQEPDNRPVTTLTMGDDSLELTAADQIDDGQVVLAGEGDDRIFGDVDVSEVEVFGEAGNDTIAIGNSTAHGGEGDDRLFIRGETGIGYGDAGDDTLRIAGFGEGTVFGGDGNDSLSMVGGFGELNGDAGNDTLLLNGVGTAHGGAGDDLIQAIYFDNAVGYGSLSSEEFEALDPVELSGGEGADTFGIRTLSATTAAVNITDFDPEEDFLVFAVPNNVDNSAGFGISVTQDAESETTIVRLTRNGVGAAGTAVLSGLLDLQPEDVGIVQSIPDFAEAEPGLNYGTVTGTFGDDTLTGEAGDTVTAGNGDDVIDVSLDASFATSVSAGAGDDQITANGTGNLDIMGDEGNDTVTVGGGIEADIRGGAGNDVLTVTQGDVAGDFHVDGGEGSDTITVGNGQSASVFLGNGDDLATVGEGLLVSISGEDGTDIVNVELTSDLTAFGTLADVNDVAGSGDIGATHVRGGSENDTININVANATEGSFHILRGYYDVNVGDPDARIVTFENYLVWSADEGADINSADFNGDLTGSGFHVLASYTLDTLDLNSGAGIEETAQTLVGPQVNTNVTIASVSSGVQCCIDPIRSG